MPIRTRTITISVNRKTADAFDAILNIPGKIMLDAKKSEDGWWSFTTQTGPARLKFNENKQLGILDHQFIDNEATWDVPMRVVANGEDSAVITTLIKPASVSNQSFDERMLELEGILKTMKKIIEEK
jgi:hypothetical protein